MANTPATPRPSLRSVGFLAVAALCALATNLALPGLLLAALSAWLIWNAALALHLRALSAPPPAPPTRPAAARIVRLWRGLCHITAANTRRLNRHWLLLALPVIGLTLRPILSTGLNAAPNHPAALPAALIAGAFIGFFLQTYAGLRATREATPWTERLTAASLRATTIVLALTAALLFAESRLGLHLHTAWSALLLAATAAWIAETGLRAAARLYLPTKYARRRPPLGAAWVLAPFLAPADRLAWRAPPESDAPSLALADMWFLPTLRRALPPLFASAVLLVWLATTLHTVPIGHAGLRDRLGRVTGPALPAGLHLSLPYPFETVRTVPADRLARIVIGLETDTGAPILWDRAHYVGEENQLVGRGEEFLTIGLPIYYHIKDPVLFNRRTADAVPVIRDLAHQLLLAETLPRQAFAIMTTDRDALAARLHERLQAELDRRQTGLAIDLVCLRDIHPPVAVGPAYQDVVSAIEEREAYIHQGENYRAENLPRARSDSARLVAQAQSAEAERIAKATGEANRFASLDVSYRLSPEIFRLRQTYAAYDEALAGVKKLVVDQSFRGRLPTYLDVRRTLNPDFTPIIVSAPATLIPSIDAKPGDFDRTIEGYLNMGNGAIPAVDIRTDTSDHLLQP